MTSGKSSLKTAELDEINNPTQKIHWALRLLWNRGHRIKHSSSENAYEIDGKTMRVQEIYALVTKFPEWNDRLGLGTARLPKVSR